MAASHGLNHEKYAKKRLPQLAYDCCGAYGEFAVAKWLGCAEPDGVNTWHGPDVGDVIQVRTIGLTEPGGPPPALKKLIVRPGEPDDHAYVLVHADMDARTIPRQCVIFGWIFGLDAQRQEWWRQDAWWVPRECLSPMATLLPTLGIKQATVTSDEINW